MYLDIKKNRQRPLRAGKIISFMKDQIEKTKPSEIVNKNRLKPSMCIKIALLCARGESIPGLPSGVSTEG